MTSPISGDSRRRNRRKLLLAALVAYIVVCAGLLTGFAILTHRAAPTEPKLESSTQGANEAAPALPRPHKTVNGVPVGYPHTTEGAVSAVVHFAEAHSTLDPDTAATVGQVVSVPHDAQEYAADLRVEVKNLRVKLGIAPEGPTGSASFTLKVGAYQIKEATPDRVVVWTLSTMTLSGPASNGASRTGTAPVARVMEWVDGDWRINTAELSIPQEFHAAPGTSEAYAKGWRDVPSER